MYKVSGPLHIHGALDGGFIVSLGSSEDRIHLSHEDVSLLMWLAVRLPARGFDPRELPPGTSLANRIAHLLKINLLRELDLSTDLDADCLRRKAAPAFILGSYRSGTTLLRYLLDAHPQIACPPESKFLLGLERLLDYPEAMTGLMSLGFSRAEMRFELRRLAECFLGGYAQRMGKRRWVEKTPNYSR